MIVQIITYDKPHRKTQDIVFRLKLSGFTDIHLFVLPWITRPPHIPLYKHRPDNAFDISVDSFAKRMNLKYIRCEYSELTKLLDPTNKTLIAGAGILPGVKNTQIINSHPGYLPNVRGLDALKWAILAGQIIGVTTHFINEEADTGTLIERNILPLYHTDSFHSIALRQYELEIEMLLRSLTITPDGSELKAYSHYPVNKRMKPLDELRMMARLNKLLKGL